MKKIILTVFSVVLFSGLSFRREIKDFIYKRNHHGLVNFDYVIISIEDLKVADKDSFAATPFNGTNIGYPYWQCFNKKYLKMDCHYNEPLHRQGSSLGIDIETEDEIHSYSLIHALSGDVCVGFKSKIHEILENRTYFCINGTNGTLDRVASKKEYSWSFYGLKTKSGYAQYFLE